MSVRSFSKQWVLAAGAVLALSFADAIAAGTIAWTPQDAASASLAPKVEREDARLDFASSAENLARRIRAFAPRPGAFTLLAGEPLRILAARAQAGAAGEAPGTIRVDPGGRELRIATGSGWLVPLVLQRAGGRALEAAEFLRGARALDGIVLPS